MRVKPVASTGSTRITQRDLHIGGFTIPANTFVVCPFDAVHHFPGNWKDADRFKPERWEEPNAEFLPGSKRREAAIKRFMAFGVGPRQCIGQSLARMMHDVGVAILLCHFSFKLAPEVCMLSPHRNGPSCHLPVDPVHPA